MPLRDLNPGNERCDIFHPSIAILGGGVFKKRLSRNLYRSIIVAKGGRYWIYAYLFAKQDRANIEDDELVAFRQLAVLYARKTAAEIAREMQFKELVEICMTKNRKYKTDAFEAIHSTVAGMYRAGTIDKTTMRSFDASCLAAPAPIGPHQIKALRESLRVSQPVFARYLNTSESTVEKWETGAKRPSGMALKLLAVVQKYGLKMLA
ncbi:MAG: type II toxin-antitoxin system RelE/ParE family toxin [Acidobacteriaceae bacterium]